MMYKIIQHQNNQLRHSTFELLSLW